MSKSLVCYIASLTSTSTLARVGRLLREDGCQKIDERAHAGRALMTFGVDRVNVCIRRVILRQHLDESTALQVAMNVPLCAHEDAVPIQCPAYGYLPVVRRQVALDLDRFDLGLTSSNVRTRLRGARAATLRVGNTFVYQRGIVNFAQEA